MAGVIALDLLVHPGRDFVNGVLGRTGQRRRRHFGGPDFAEGRFPSVALTEGSRWILQERLEVEVGGLLFRIMTTQAIAGKKGADRLTEGGLMVWIEVRLLGRRESGAEHQRCHGNDYLGPIQFAHSYGRCGRGYGHLYFRIAFL